MKKFLTIENILSALIFCLPLYLLRISFLGFSTNIFELLALSAFIFCLSTAKNDWTKQIQSFPKKIAAAILFLVFGVFFSTVFNDNYRSGFGILKSWFLLPIFFSFLFYALLKSKEGMEKFFLSIYLSSATVGLFSLFYKILGSVTYDNRLKAFYLSPNHLAMYLAYGIFFGLYFIHKNYARRDKLKIFLSCTPLLLIIIPFYFTFSYGAWVAVLVSILLVISLAFPTKKLFFAILFVLITTSVFALQASSAKFNDLRHFSERSSFASRTMIWKSSWLMLQQSPFVGIGPGNFQNTYLSFQKFFPPYLEWAAPQPHNIFLAFWLQAGVLGFAGFLILIFSAFKNLLSARKKEAMLVLPLIGFFSYTLLHGLIDTTYWKNDLSFLFWICISFVFIIRNKNLTQ